ncbi:MAG: amidohydrolase family protein, partial [Stellaceae bacterium]
RREAVAMWTRDAAKVLRWDGIGLLTPGAHADLVVVDRDLMTCETEEIGAATALLTLAGGEPMHGEI